MELIEKQHALAVIPSRKHRNIQRNCDWWLYKERHLVECLFNKLKHYRKLATGYDKLSCTFAAFLSLAFLTKALCNHLTQKPVFLLTE
ncbi:transposase [Paenibacillus larvae]|uniref:transposase n=1 Tax=Paenibacillus larvae TaxID=1464 RepID=UPI000CF53861|nr:transposase [Paenibacillus larvae]MCY9775473.1 hypothetical protein [Paenibacillus larvae]